MSLAEVIIDSNRREGDASIVLRTQSLSLLVGFVLRFTMRNTMCLLHSEAS